MKPTYEEIGKVFDSIVLKHLYSKGIDLTDKKLIDQKRQDYEKEWNEYLLASGWTKKEWEDELLEQFNYDLQGLKFNTISF